MDIKVHYFNSSYARIECDDSTFFDLRDYFSFHADGYQFNPKYKYSQWDGKIRLLESNRLLPIGLASQTYKFASSNDYTCWIDPNIIEKEPISKEVFDTWLKAHTIYAGGNVITPHWYQEQAVWEAVHNRRRILNLPTSAGKSLIQALLTKYYLDHYEGNVLVIVPTTALVTQMRDDFVDYRLFKYDEIAEMRAGKRPNGQRIIVSTWQTAIKQGAEWLEQFGMVLCDEMHLATGKSISDIIKGLTNCMFKLGLSGSLKDGKANLMQYVGMFGEIFRPVSTSELMEQGAVTDLKINALFLRYPDEVVKILHKKVDGKKVTTYADEIKIITKFKPRNKWACNLAVQLAKKDKNIFMMFKNIEHGKALVEQVKALGYDKVYYVSGEVKSDERTALKKMAENETGMIVVASYGVFSTGISVKNLHHVILAHPVKSKVIVLQTIGRVLRKHGSKELATVWDLIDDIATRRVNKETGREKVTNHNYALKHGIERIERYASEKFNYVMKTIVL